MYAELNLIDFSDMNLSMERNFMERSACSESVRNLDLCEEFYGGEVPAVKVWEIWTSVRNFMEVKYIQRKCEEFKPLWGIL